MKRAALVGNVIWWGFNMLGRRTFLLNGLAFLVGASVPLQATAHWVHKEKKRKIARDAENLPEQYYRGKIVVGDKLPAGISRQYIDTSSLGLLLQFVGYYASKVNGEIVVTKANKEVRVVMTVEEVKAALGVD